MARIVGVDGYARGWVAVELDRHGAFAGAWVAPSLTLLLAGVPAGAAVGVDIPLGLLESGWRSADRAAAARLGPRRASVFAVPPRDVWTMPNHAEANRLCARLTGGGLSAQAWSIRGRVLEADAYRDSGRHELVEVHPELVFAGLAGAPLGQPKRTWNGQHTRRHLLADAGVRLPDELAAAGAVPADDLLDAAAVAWCAGRFARGQAGQVPDPADQFDHRGRAIVIRY